jgi:hypothetical protein
MGQHMHKFTIKQFKTALSQDVKPQKTMVAKSIDCQVKEVDVKSRRIKFVSSTKSVDRDNDTIDPQGWDLSHYNDKGVFLWAHDSSKPPIGKGLHAVVENGELLIDVEFLPSDLADHEWVKFSNMIFEMYQRGILKDVSVGFMPQEYSIAEDRGGFMPTNFLQQELLELSAVPVGSNPDVRPIFEEAKGAGIDVAPVVDWVEDAINGNNKGVWVDSRILKNIKAALTTANTEQESTAPETTDKSADNDTDQESVDTVDAEQHQEEKKSDDNKEQEHTSKRFDELTKKIDALTGLVVELAGSIEESRAVTTVAVKQPQNETEQGEDELQEKSIIEILLNAQGADEATKQKTYEPTQEELNEVVKRVFFEKFTTPTTGKLY